MKIRLLMLGKIRRPEVRAVLDDYVKRIGRACAIEITEVRDGEAALKKLDAPLVFISVAWLLDH